MATKKKIAKKVVAKKKVANIIATVTVIPTAAPVVATPAIVTAPSTWRKQRGDGTWHRTGCDAFPAADFVERTEKPTSNLCPRCQEG